MKHQPGGSAVISSSENGGVMADNVSQQYQRSAAQAQLARSAARIVGKINGHGVAAKHERNTAMAYSGASVNRMALMGAVKGVM